LDIFVFSYFVYICMYFSGLTEIFIEVLLTYLLTHILQPSCIKKTLNSLMTLKFKLIVNNKPSPICTLTIQVIKQTMPTEWQRSIQLIFFLSVFTHLFLNFLLIWFPFCKYLVSVNYCSLSLEGLSVFDSDGWSVNRFDKTRSRTDERSNKNRNPI